MEQIKGKLSEIEGLMTKGNEELDKINQAIQKLTELRANTMNQLFTLNGQKMAYQSMLSLIEVPEGTKG
jgi:hypothetical protein